MPKWCSRRQRHYGIDCVLRPEWSDESSEEFGRNEPDERCLVGACDYAVRPTGFAQYAGRWCHLQIQDVDEGRMGRYACRHRLGSSKRIPDEGSQATQALQEKLGVEADGFIGPETISALQQHLKIRGHDLAKIYVAGYCTVEYS